MILVVRDWSPSKLYTGTLIQLSDHLLTYYGWARALTPTLLHTGATFLALHLLWYALCTISSTNSSLSYLVGYLCLQVDLAPCFLKSPPNFAWFLHFFCTMPKTNSSLINVWGASFVVASLFLCSVPHTNTSADNYIGTSLMFWFVHHAEGKLLHSGLGWYC